MLSGAFCTAVGRVSDAPRIKDGNNKMATFRIGIPEKGRDGETSWTNLDVVVFGRLAEIVEQYVGKGSEVLVSGKLRQRDYTDGQDNKRTSFQITANELQLGARPEGQDGKEKPKTTAAASKPAPKAADDFPDDVPF